MRDLANLPQKCPGRSKRPGRSQLNVFNLQLLTVAAVVLTGCSSDQGYRALARKHLSPITRFVTGKTSSESGVTDEQAMNVELALARTLETKGETETAIGTYRKILDRDPKNPTAMHRLAVLYDKQGRFDESDELFRKALQLQPNDPDLYCDLGYSLYSRRRWAEAEVNLRKALKLNPDHARAHNHLGLLLCQLDRRTEALGEFRKAGCTIAEAHMNAALVLTMRDRLAEARQEYALASQADPGKSQLVRSRLQEIDALMADESSEHRAVAHADSVGRASLRPQQGGTVQSVVQRPLSARSESARSLDVPSGSQSEFGEPAQSNAFRLTGGIEANPVQDRPSSQTVPLVYEAQGDRLTEPSLQLGDIHRTQ